MADPGVLQHGSVHVCPESDDLQKLETAIAASLFPSLLMAIPLNAILEYGSEGCVWVHVSPESEEV